MCFKVGYKMNLQDIFVLGVILVVIGAYIFILSRLLKNFKKSVNDEIKSLKEKVSKNIFLASLISFIGVIIILRPGFNKFDEGYIFSFCSTGSLVFYKRSIIP